MDWTYEISMLMAGYLELQKIMVVIILRINEKDNCPPIIEMVGCTASISLIQQPVRLCALMHDAEMRIMSQNVHSFFGIMSRAFFEMTACYFAVSHRGRIS